VRLLALSVGWVPLAFLSDGVTVLILPTVLGSDATAIGLVSFAGIGLGVLTQLLAGEASDRLRGRIGRRVFLTIAAAPVLLALAALGGGIAPIVAYLAVQVTANTVQAAQQTLIPEHVEPGQHGRAAGWKTAFDVGGSFLAFAVLGVLIESAGLMVAVVAIGATLVGAVLIMWLGDAMPTERRLIARPAPAAGALTRLILARFLFLFGTYAVGRFLLLLVEDRSGAGAGVTGALLAGLTLLTAVTAIPAGRVADRIGRDRAMTVGAVVASLGIVTLIPSLELPGIVLGGALMAVGTALFISANWSATTGIVPAPGAGRVMAIANVGTGAAAAAAGLLGPVIDVAGFGTALAIAALVSVAAVVPLVGIGVGRPVREQPA